MSKITRRSYKRKKIVMGFWETLPDSRIVMRIATSWATTEENVEKLISLL